ncbi:MAG: hypothetical protein RLY14_3313 [Planctomycetota bacterium]|jgi:hypothetical protein
MCRGLWFGFEGFPAIAYLVFHPQDRHSAVPDGEGIGKIFSTSGWLRYEESAWVLNGIAGIGMF